MKHIDRQIQAYCDNELPAPRRQAFEDHVRRCAACRRQLEANQRLWQDVAAAPAVELRRSVWPEVARRLGPQLSRRRQPTIWTWSQRGLAAAALIAGVLVGFRFGGPLDVANDEAETITASVDYLEQSLPSLDQLWLELDSPDEDGES